MASDGIDSSVSLGAQPQKKLRISEPPNLSHQRETEVLQQIHSSKILDSTTRGLDKNSASQAIKSNFQQNQFKKKSEAAPKESTLKVNLKILRKL